MTVALDMAIFPDRSYNVAGLDGSRLFICIFRLSFRRSCNLSMDLLVPGHLSLQKKTTGSNWSVSHADMPQGINDIDDRDGRKDEIYRKR